MKRLTAICALLLASCATPPPPKPAPVEHIVLLPHADGTPSSMVVRSENGETVLSSPYSEALVSNGQVTPEDLGEVPVRERYAAELKALPRRPQRYELLFEINADKLTRESKIKFDTAMHDIVSFPAAEVIVIGHADRSGTPDYNMVLSIRRAESIRHMLISAGMDASRIQAIGRGDLESAVAQAAGTTEPRNRRVEIKLR
jgi:outer membrane protein OmpA-like peptidoglycan-associated protein